MPKFSKRSMKTLRTVHPDLQTLFQIVVKHFDCTIISGLRTLEEQQVLYAQGRIAPGGIVTNADGIINKSNHQSGNAVDVTPFPELYSDKNKLIEFGGYVQGVADMLRRQSIIDIEIEWGGHWSFFDPAHYQIK